MRSLTAKLVLAFLVTSVVGVVLAALIMRASVANSFDDYVLEQRRVAVLGEFVTFYQAQGTWEGIERRPREQSGRPQPGMPIDAKPGQGGGRPPQLMRHAPFALANTDGVVIVPFERFELGERVEPGTLARGSAVVVDGRVVGTMLLAAPLTLRNPAEELFLSGADRALALAGAASIGIALAVGALLAHLITRPARDLTRAAERIAAGDLEQKVPVRSRDELGQLAEQFNTMSAQLARALALRRQMTADIAHDLRTPLTVIAGYLEALRDRVLAPTPERFVMLQAETQLLLRLVEDLHTLSLADAGTLTLQRTALAPRDILERTATAFQHAAEQQGVTIEVTAHDDLPSVNADPEQVARVMANLVSNAVRYTPAGGYVRLSAERVSAGLALRVSDTGPGIAPEQRAYIFERFWRADASRSADQGGSGLGLAIARSIVEAHGGQIQLMTSPGHGATFTVMLPLA